MNLDKELAKIIEEGTGENEWQNKAIRILAMSVLDTRQKIDKLNFKLNVIIYMYATVIALLIVNVIKLSL